MLPAGRWTFVFHRHRLRTLPPIGEVERLGDAYAVVALDARCQVVGLFRPVARSAGGGPELGAGRARPGRVRIGGLVVTRQHPMTAKGTVFLALEDETGMVNVTLWPDTWARLRGVVRRHALLLVDGDAPARSQRSSTSSPARSGRSLEAASAAAGRTSRRASGSSVGPGCAGWAEAPGSAAAETSATTARGQRGGKRQRRRAAVPFDRALGLRDCCWRRGGVESARKRR